MIIFSSLKRKKKVTNSSNKVQQFCVPSGYGNREIQFYVAGVLRLQPDRQEDINIVGIEKCDDPNFINVKVRIENS